MSSDEAKRLKYLVDRYYGGSHSDEIKWLATLVRSEAARADAVEKEAADWAGKVGAALGERDRFAAELESMRVRLAETAEDRNEWESEWEKMKAELAQVRAEAAVMEKQIDAYREECVRLRSAWDVANSEAKTLREAVLSLKDHWAITGGPQGSVPFLSRGELKDWCDETLRATSAREECRLSNASATAAHAERVKSLTAALEEYRNVLSEDSAVPCKGDQGGVWLDIPWSTIQDMQAKADDALARLDTLDYRPNVLGSNVARKEAPDGP